MKKTKLTDEELLENAGWTVICESPFEITKEEFIVTGEGVYSIVNFLRKEKENEVKEDITETVQSINWDIWDIFGEDLEGKYVFRDELYVEYTSIGISEKITFLGVCVWSDEEDERVYNDEKDEYEPLEPYLRRKINDVLIEVAMIKLEITNEA